MKISRIIGLYLISPFIGIVIAYFIYYLLKYPDKWFPELQLYALQFFVLGIISLLFSLNEKEVGDNE